MKVEILALPQRDGTDISALVGELSLLIASELGEEGSFTKWVIWRTVEPGQYSNGKAEPAVQPRETHPPYVTVYAFESPEREARRERVMTAIGEFVSDGLGLEPGNAVVNWFDIRVGYAYYHGIVGVKS